MFPDYWKEIYNYTDSETEEISDERSIYINPGSKEFQKKEHKETSQCEMSFWEKFKYFFKLLFGCLGRL